MRPCASLQAMARANGLTVLACILNLANAEADRIAEDAAALACSLENPEACEACQ